MYNLIDPIRVEMRRQKFIGQERPRNEVIYDNTWLKKGRLKKYLAKTQLSTNNPKFHVITQQTHSVPIVLRPDIIARRRSIS
jgi:hypothetical protein